MDKWIERICEPGRLLLAWQAPDGRGDRFRWAIGEVTLSDGGYSLRYIKEPGEFGSLNQGRAFKQLKELGFTEYPGLPWKQSHHVTGVREAFVRRLPPRERTDVQEYLARFGIPAGAKVSDFALLGYTEGKLPGDGFSFVDPLDSDCKYQFVSEIAGFRYYADELASPLTEGARVELELEPDNSKDPLAVKVTRGGEKIGNINRLQTKAFRSWLEVGRVQAQVVRLNGTRQKPVAYIYVDVLRKAAVAA